MLPSKNIEQAVAETLNSFDGISRADAPDFFYTRLEARLHHSPSEKGFWNLITKPAFSLVSLSLLLLLNIAAVTHYVSTGTVLPAEEKTTGIQRFAQEFDLSISSVYNDKTARQ